MLRPALRQEDFDTEKNVILEEIALYEDRPQYRLFEKLMAEHFGAHPLGKSVLGTVASITALKRDDMLAYFNRRYSPGNVTLVGVGRLDWDALVKKAAAMCGHWQDYPAPRQTDEAAGTGKSAAVADAKLLRQHFGMMSQAPTARDERRFAANLLSSILGDATGSRLFYALIEPAIAEDASCSYEAFDGAGGLLTFVSADPERAAEALAIVRREYAKFLADGPTDEELRAAQNKIASAATLRGELPMGRLTAVGFDWVYRQDYIPLDEQIQRVMRVTKAEVHAVARQYDITRATVLTLGPKDKL
jgi:predicted Zn-dependent peptidase